MTGVQTCAIPILEEEIRQLREREEHMKERMVKNAETLLLHNPGSRFMIISDNAAEIRERIRRRKKNKDIT